MCLLWLICHKIEKAVNIEASILVTTQNFKGPLLGLRKISGNWKPFKSDEQGILFHAKTYFGSWDIMDMWKKGLIRKPWLISNFVVSESVQLLINWSRIATPPQIFSNLLKFEISPQISSNPLKKCRFSWNPPQISSNLKNRKFHFGNLTVK